MSHVKDKRSPIRRRTVLTLLGSAAAVDTGATAAAAENSDEDGYPTIRLRGSYERPVSLKDARSRLRRLVETTPTAGRSLLADRAVPEFDSGSEIVEYVARIDPNGALSQYYGAADRNSVDDAHAKADKKETAFRETVATQDTNMGPDWSYLKDDQASNSKHFGEIINNLEWYRERDGDQERNAFRSKMACSDDTIFGYDRKMHAKHDWGVSELGGEAIHEADPGTTDNSPVDVSIGIPPELQLSWSFGDSGSITHNLNTDGPTAKWTRDLPKSGTVWFHPGSHVVSDRASCGDKQDVVKLKATGEWGWNVYKVSHTWNIWTGTC